MTNRIKVGKSQIGRATGNPMTVVLNELLAIHQGESLPVVLSQSDLFSRGLTVASSKASKRKKAKKRRKSRRTVRQIY